MALVAICSALAVIVTPRALRESQANSSSMLVASVLRDAREEAIAKRRNIEVAFVGTNQIEVTRIEYTFAPPAAPEVVRKLERTVFLEGTIEYRRPSNEATPFAPADPAPVTYGVVSGSPRVTFTTEGAAIGADGNPVDGAIFLSKAGETSLARAVSMTGVTALVDRWDYDGVSWRLAK